MKKFTPKYRRKIIETIDFSALQVVQNVVSYINVSRSKKALKVMRKITALVGETG